MPHRLLLVVDSLDGGGAERYVADLACALAARGRRVTVACSAGGVLEAPLRAAGVPVRPLLGRLVKRRASGSYARALRELVLQERHDLVHAHIYASATASAIALAGLGVPLVVTDHTEAPWRGRAARELSRWTYGRAAHVVAVSRAIERLLTDAYHVPRERVSCLFPALAALPPGPPGALPTALDGAPLVGRIARLAPEKGIDVFLRAAAAVAARVPAARFAVIGEGPERADLEALAARLGLAGRVAFLGFRPDARRLAARLDVMAVSSLSDGCPLVVLEAMSAGVPVVASAVGGIPDQVRHGREGLLVAPGDPTALGEAIAAVLEDPGHARGLGEAGRARARAFSHARLVDRMEAIYGAVLREPEPAFVSASQPVLATAGKSL